MSRKIRKILHDRALFDFRYGQNSKMAMPPKNGIAKSRRIIQKNLRSAIEATMSVLNTMFDTAAMRIMRQPPDRMSVEVPEANSISAIRAVDNVTASMSVNPESAATTSKPACPAFA